MCIREIVTPGGILVRFNDQKLMFSGLRRTLGLEDKEEAPTIQQIKTKPAAPLIPVTRTVTERVYSGRPCRMGSALGGPKMIRGCWAR